MKATFLQYKDEHSGNAKIRLLIAEVKAEPRIEVNLVEQQEEILVEVNEENEDEIGSDVMPKEAEIRTIKEITGWDCDILESTKIGRAHV